MAGPVLAPAPRRKAPVGCHPDPVGTTRGTPRDPKTKGVLGQTHREPPLWARGGGVQGAAVTPNPELWDGGRQSPMRLWGNALVPALGGPQTQGGRSGSVRQPRP